MHVHHVHAHDKLVHVDVPINYLWPLLMNYLCQLYIMHIPVQILFCALGQSPEASRYDTSVSLAPVNIKVSKVSKSKVIRSLLDKTQYSVNCKQ